MIHSQTWMPNPDIARFGPFEFDTAAGELRKNGLRIHLHGQPMAILALLLGKPGELVTRQEFQARLWPADTFVDFERGLNAGVTRLRAALSDSADQPRFLETVPRRGYRFIAPVSRPSAIGPPADPPPTLTRLAVLPFDQLVPDPETAFLSFSLPDAITSSLAGFPSLIVRSSRITAGPGLAALATEANVDAVITGTILRSGNLLRVCAQLVQVPAGTVVWTHEARLPMGDLFELLDELIRRIIGSLAPSVAVRIDQPRRDVPASARAYELYLRANHLSTQIRDLTLARDLYRACLDEDPHYAPAWARLARCHRILAKFRAGSEDHVALADQAFARAFALNPQLPGIHSQYAFHETEQGRAKEAMVRLLRLLPNHPHDPDLYASLVYACRYAGLVEASLRAHRAAKKLDRGARTSVMNTHLVMGEYAAALEASIDDVGFMDAMVLDGLGRRTEALDRLRRREHLPPLMIKWLQMLELYLQGHADDAVHRLVEMDREGVDPEGFFYRARLLARLGRTDEAIDGLERSLRAGFFCAPAWLANDYLEPIRHFPRFRQLHDTAAQLTAEAHQAYLAAGGDEALPEQPQID